MELKRLTLALILCFIFVVAYTKLLEVLNPPVEPPVTEEVDDGTTPEDPRDASLDDAARAGDPVADGADGGESSTTPEGTTLGPRIIGEEAPPIRVETDRFIAELTNRGAVPIRVLAKGLTREAGLDASVEANLVAIVDTFEEGRKPFLFTMSDGKYDLANLDWVYKGETLEGDEEVHTYEIAPGDGVRIVKRFRFADGRDHISIDVDVHTEHQDVVAQRRTFEMTGPQGVVYEGDPTRTQDQTFALTLITGRNAVRAADPKAIRKNEGPLQYSTDIDWMAVVSKYFAAILDPVEAPGPVEHGIVDSVLDPVLYDLRRSEGTLPGDAARESASTKLGVHVRYFEPLAAVGQKLEFEFRAYLGLMDRSHLGKNGDYADYAPLLEHTSAPVCGMGWLIKPIASLLLAFMNLIYSVVGNYGVAIILLTCLIKLAMFPATRHQQISMAKYQAKMAKHKPELDRIREKYKNNKQKLNEHTLKFFKEKGISPFPFGGCLPLFATMPIFFGLFYLLRTAPELRQAGFMLWITDLSRPDQLVAEWPHINLICMQVHGLNLLPILMTIAWFLQQRSMPKPADPQQAQTQQMMMFMPILFGFLLYDYASGLSLYWLTNSLFGLVEQKIIRKNLPPGTKTVGDSTPAKP